MGLIPRDEKFFGLFEELAKRLSGSAELVHRLFSEPQSLAQQWPPSRSWSTRPTTSRTT